MFLSTIVSVCTTFVVPAPIVQIYILSPIKHSVSVCLPALFQKYSFKMNSLSLVLSGIALISVFLAAYLFKFRKNLAAVFAVGEFTMLTQN